jgi:hypothetical protein
VSQEDHESWWQCQKSLWRLWAVNACVLIGVLFLIATSGGVTGTAGLLTASVSAWGFFIWSCLHEAKSRKKDDDA